MSTNSIAQEYDVEAIHAPWYTRFDPVDGDWWIHDSDKFPVAKFSYKDQAVQRAKLAAQAPALLAALEGIATMHVDEDTDHHQLSALCMAIALTAIKELETA